LTLSWLVAAPVVGGGLFLHFLYRSELSGIGRIMKQPSAKAFAIATLVTVSFPSLLLAFRGPEMILKPLQTGIAACYSKQWVGHRTTSGQRYDPNALTAAHGKLPLGTHVRVTNLENGKSVIVVVNDRMSSHGRIIMDVSQRACRELQLGPNGEAKIKLEIEPSKAARTD
jgi:rare lipoprotein A